MKDRCDFLWENKGDKEWTEVRMRRSREYGRMCSKFIIYLYLNVHVKFTTNVHQLEKYC